MNGEGLYIDPASMRDLNINIKQFTKYVLKTAHGGLRDFAMYIVAAAKEKLRHDGHIASGFLRNSGHWVENADGTWDAGFYCSYAEAVEYGRKSGKMPPVDDIYQWLQKKDIMPTGEKRTRNADEEAFRYKSQSGALKRMRYKILGMLGGNTKYKDLSDTEKKRYSLAWAIALTIAEKGTKPHPFLKPSYERYRNKIDEYMQRRINEAVEKFKPKK